MTAQVAWTDTAYGRVVEVGADPATWIALEPPAGGVQVRLVGAAVSALRSVPGAEVWVSGARGADGFRVDVFEVRRVNGQPVDDGIVVVTGSTVAVRTRSGAQRDIPEAPAALRQLAGARIWVSRPVAGVAPSYGVIASP